MRSRILVASLTVMVLSGCGAKPAPKPVPAADQARATVERFGVASAKKDYQQICDQLITPALVKGVEEAGVPCELAFKQGLGDVRAPTLKVLSVQVTGDRASARVTSSAQGEKPLTDVLRLERVQGTWRIAALGSAA